MSNGKPEAPAPVKEIIHSTRNDTDDVNPLIRQSGVPLANDDGNYIVVQQKKGQLHLGPEVNVPIAEKMLLNKIVAYYEVSKRRYPFKVSYNNIASEQATMNFDVAVEFTVQVTDPRQVVEQRITSLLDCIRMDLKREVVRVVAKYNIRNSRAAQNELQETLEAFTCAPWMAWTCHLVTVSPDSQAMRKLREIEEKDLNMGLLATQTDLDLAAKTGAALTDKIVRTRVDNLEEHQIAKLAPVDRLLHDGQESSPPSS